ncbi:MAG: RNA-binding region [Akkermansiaceae bacterium]|nr:RNA-binding region [Akkermansiaceae bacterium]
MIIIVRNIDRSVTETEMHAMIARFGQVTAFDLVMDRETGQSKGFGFASMPNEKQAVLAIKALNGRMVGKEEIRLKKAAPSSIKKYNRQQQ